MAICRPIALRYSYRIKSSCVETILPAGCHQQSYMKPWRGRRGCNCRPLSVIRACGTARRWTASFTDPTGTTEPCRHYHIKCLILGLSPAMPILTDLCVREEKEIFSSSLPPREFIADASYIANRMKFQGNVDNKA